MKHEHHKEIIAGLAGVSKETIRASGEVLRGLLGNQIAGTAFFILAAYALYPQWLPFVSSATAEITKDIAQAWHDSIVPSIPGFANSSRTPPSTPATDATKPKPADFTYYYLWIYKVIGGWGQYFYSDVKSGNSDFDTYNLIGTAGNLVQVDVTWVLREASSGERPPGFIGPIAPAAPAQWVAEKNETVIKKSTLHSDVGPRTP